MHMISKKDLSDAEMETVTKSCSPTIVITGNGEVQTHEEATVYVKELEKFLTMKVLENTPAVLSLGKLCDENGSSYEWINGQKPHLIKDGIRIICNTENFVPIVVPGLSASSSSSLSTPTSMTPLSGGLLLRLVSTYRHLGTQASHGSKARSGARTSSFRRKSGVPSHAQEDFESEASRVAVAHVVVSSRLLHGAGTWHSLSVSDINAMEDTYMAPFRTIANERWRPGYVPASSQKVSSAGHCRLPGGGQHVEIAFGCTAGKCFSLADGSLAI